MATFDSWESYFYPETCDPITQGGTLRNLYDERNVDTLRGLEYGAADRRSVELRLGIADVPRSYDAEHIQAIHGYLFQDVYEWAGQFRTVVNRGRLSWGAVLPSSWPQSGSAATSMTCSIA